MDIEILAKSESVKYLGQRISFYQQETLEIKSRIRAAWTTFRKYRQELTSKKYMLKLRLRLLHATVSPTLCYASGTWSTEPWTRKNDSIDATQEATPHHSDEKKIQKKLKSKLSNIQLRKEMTTKQKIVALMTKAAMIRAPNLKMIWEDDMDSGVTFDEDSEKDIDTAEIEEEDWFDYLRRSAADAIDKMEHAKIRCWNRSHRKMKWKLALRIAASPSERWIKKKLLNEPWAEFKI